VLLLEKWNSFQFKVMNDDVFQPVVPVTSRPPRWPCRFCVFVPNNNMILMTMIILIVAGLLAEDCGKERQILLLLLFKTARLRFEPRLKHGSFVNALLAAILDLLLLHLKIRWRQKNGDALCKCCVGLGSLKCRGHMRAWESVGQSRAGGGGDGAGGGVDGTSSSSSLSSSCD
jgi:hypothetical protein